MTAGQRRWHVRIWLVLAPLVALGVALALVAGRSAAS
jgi:hypothetical protein